MHYMTPTYRKELSDFVAEQTGTANWELITAHMLQNKLLNDIDPPKWFSKMNAMSWLLTKVKQQEKQSSLELMADLYGKANDVHSVMYSGKLTAYTVRTEFKNPTYRETKLTEALKLHPHKVKNKKVKHNLWALLESIRFNTPYKRLGFCAVGYDRLARMYRLNNSAEWDWFNNHILINISQD